MTVESLTSPDGKAMASAATGNKARARRWSRRVAADTVSLMDCAAVVAGSAVPGLIYEGTSGIHVDWRLLIQAAICASIIAQLALRSWGQYDASRLHDFSLSLPSIAGSLALGLLATAGLGIPPALRAGHEVIWIATWFTASFGLMLINRAAARIVLSRLTAAGYFDERVAVFGAGTIARRVHDHLSNPKLGVHFAGVFDDRSTSDRLDPDGLALAGRLEDLVDIARSQKIDKIIIALPQTASARIESIAKKLEELPVSVHIVTHLASDFVRSSKPLKVSAMGSVGLMDIKKKALSDWQPIVKRAEDIIVGSLLLLLSAPLFPIIAAAIRYESSGPVLFRQRRRGFNQQIIEIYKFRTMRVLEDGPHIKQATFGDDRVTRIGRILRRTSLDELPQLWNVLQGSMSLVGPRPHALAHDEQFSEMLEHYASRHQMKPGLTGLAQVRGFRGETSTPMSIESRVNADIAYIKNWSLGLDLLILAQTVWAVLTAKNAH
jgi:Undecaprenyl-phosphate glucose phosphotransferase